MNFKHFFKEVSPEELDDNVFTLVGKDFFVNIRILIQYFLKIKSEGIARMNYI